jgi:hypothetical protein
MWYPGALEPKLAIALVIAVLGFAWLAGRALKSEVTHVAKQQTGEVSDDCREAPEPARGH